MYKKNKNKNKIITITLVCAIAVALGLFYSLKLDRKMTLVEGFFKDVTILVQKVVMYPFVALNDNKDKTLSDSYVIQKNVNSSLEKEIKELKDTLNLNKTFTEYKPVNATVISRNRAYFFNTITIDKGKKAGIKRDMAVVSTDGLIGKITKVSNYSSEIKLLTSDDLNYKVSVSISTGNGDSYAILNGYDKKKRTLVIGGVDKDIEVKKDDVILTSGLGELFPRGIYIGRVKEVESDKYNLSKNLYVETSADFSSIHYVTVLTENK